MINSSLYDDDVVHKLHNMVKKIVMQIKYHTFSEKDHIYVIFFLQYFESICEACKNHGILEMWLFRHYLTGPTKAAVRARVVL